MSLLNKASLIQIPSGYKDGKLYSAKPTNGDGDFTFSRGSNLAATRVNSDGLIEKGRENLFTYSNDFSNAAWTKYNGVTLSGGESGYDGSNDAWLVTKPAQNFTGVGQNVSSASGVITFSVYMKAGTLSIATIRLIGIPDRNVAFDLSNGTIFGGSSSLWIDRKIESVGGGWYKCSLTLSNTGNTLAVIYPDEISDTTGGTIYIQDAQLEAGLIATDYIETGASTAQAGILEDMPRLDYSGGASCPSLLLEPQRTNAIIDSEYFSGGWTKFGGSTIEVGYQSPEGLNNAVKATRGSNRTLMRSNNYATLSVNNVFSIYAKSGSINKISLDIGDEGETEFDLTDEWQRFDIVVNPSTYRFCDISMPNSSLSEDYFYIYGAMLETSASYPTSYIPTYGASVTRGVDDAVATHTISDTETLTYYTEFIAPEQTSGGGEHLLENSSGSSRIRIYQNNSTSIRIRTDSPSANFDYSYSSLGIDVGDTVKVALSIDSGVMTAFINGVKKNTFSSATINFARLHLRPQTIITYNTGIIFNSALSDDECIQLTTL